MLIRGWTRLHYLRLTRCSIFLGIPKDTTAIIHSDIQPDKGSKEHRLAGGFHYGQSQLGPIYMIPRPLLDHGPHRCMSPVLVPFPPSSFSSSAVPSW